MRAIDIKGYCEYKENISKKQIDDLQISNEIKSILSQVSATNNPTVVK